MDLTDLIQILTNLKGPLDAIAQMPVYKNFLQFKVAAQYGKNCIVTSNTN